MNEKATNKIQEIIEASGNNFHSSVIKFLREKEWTVLISPYYNDYATDKAREIDVIAEKTFEVKDSLWGRPKGYLNVRFIIECKYISGETVFWFDAKDKKRAEEMVVRETPLEKNNIYTQKHHYIQDERVAKLFSSVKSKDLVNEPIYKAINQNLNALIYFRRTAPLQQQDHILSTICYPIIILNDFRNIFCVNIGENSYSNITGKFFQLEINYAYLDINKRNMNEYFLIDVVDFSHLDAFLSEIQTKDIEAIKAML